MKIRLEKRDIENPLVALIERMSGEGVRNCYQCGNCSGGCPVSFAMDIPPSQVIRFLQLGKTEEVFSSNSMWLCVGCLQCYSRCPKGVSAARLFEAMRQINLRKGRDHRRIKDVPFPFLKDSPQQAIVCGFRKFVG